MLLLLTQRMWCASQCWCTCRILFLCGCLPCFCTSEVAPTNTPLLHPSLESLCKQLHHEVLENFGKLSFTLQGHGHEWSFLHGFVYGVHLQIEMRKRRLEKFTRRIDKCRSS